MSLSESANPGETRLLNEVRAKIFYLASDVEMASQPAAMLLRAVAESIVEASEAPAYLNGHLNGRAALKSAAAIQYRRSDEIRSPTPPVRATLPPPEQHAGAVGSRSGHKR
jgi:hypothetical protein